MMHVVFSHSWLHCADWHEAAASCKGWPRNFYKRPSIPIGQESGRSSRASNDVPRGLSCDETKERINNPISDGYNSEYPMAKLAAGSSFVWTWPAKNHSQVGEQRGVQIYISRTHDGGDDFSHIISKEDWLQQHRYLTHTFSECDPPGPKSDMVVCKGTYMVPRRLAPGIYTFMWWWEFDPGEIYKSCADVEVLPAPTRRPPSASPTALPFHKPDTNVLNHGAPAGSPVARHGRLFTSGSHIVDEQGYIVQLRGVSLYWSQWFEGSMYYNHKVIRWLVEDWHVSLVRVAMGVEDCGILKYTVREKQKVRNAVDAALEVGMYVIIDWQDNNADRNVNNAKNFFGEMAATYGHHPNVLFEIFAEPVQQDWTKTIKPYHEAVIPIIRRSSSNIIILGTPSFSRDVEGASLNPVAGSNLAYSLHFYAAVDKESLRQNARAAMTNGVAIFVTQWGACLPKGFGNFDFDSAEEWLGFLNANRISYANWALTIDSVEGCTALKPGASADGGWSSNQLSVAGQFVRSSIRQPQAPIDLLVAASSSSVRTSSGGESPGILSIATSAANGGFSFVWAMCIISVFVSGLRH